MSSRTMSVLACILLSVTAAACGGSDDDSADGAIATTRAAADTPTTVSTTPAPPADPGLCGRFDVATMSSLFGHDVVLVTADEDTCSWRGTEAGQEGILLLFGPAECKKAAHARTIYEGDINAPHLTDGFEGGGLTYYGTTPDGTCVTYFAGIDGTDEQREPVLDYLASLMA